MPLFSVNTIARFPDVVIEADSMTQACDLAVQHVLLTQPGSYNVSPEVRNAPPHVQADFARGLVKSPFQTCEHCGQTAHKSEWGPGWITCPGCGKHPRTPEQARVAELVDAPDSRPGVPQGREGSSPSSGT